MADKSLLARTDLDQKIRSVSFSADAAHLAVGLGDGSFRVLKARFECCNSFILLNRCYACIINNECIYIQQHIWLAFLTPFSWTFFCNVFASWLTYW